MATQFVGNAVPPSLAPLPFLFARPRTADRECNVQSALAAAVAAERADDTPRNTRCRIAWLLCETAFQLARRREDADLLPITRGRIGDALGVALCRVKRTLALLCLSRAIEIEGESIRILDWHRLCGVARYDPARLGLAAEDEDFELEEPELASPLTAAGDPACFT